MSAIEPGVLLSSDTIEAMQRLEQTSDYPKTASVSDLYTFTLCRADWERVILGLRNEAYNLSQESNRACKEGSRNYAGRLAVESAIFNAIASDIDFILPE
jgi:hypothetical protein